MNATRLPLYVFACLMTLVFGACELIEDPPQENPCHPGDRRLGAEGCGECVCSDDGAWVCPDIACIHECEGVPAPDAGACMACECVEGEWNCLPTPCPMPFCEPGEQRPADDGCNTCTCTDDFEWACTERACPPAECEDVLCDLACPGGQLARNEQGCEICACPPGECEEVLCDLACPGGQLARNEQGCEICACPPPPACDQGCPEIYSPVCGSDGHSYDNACEAICHDVGVSHDGLCADDCPICDLFCEFGYAADENGCGGCACLCPEGETDGVRYLSRDPEVCQAIDFDCPAGTRGFSDPCGCGCFADPEVLCACPLIDAPVCGADGQTYGNECAAGCAGVRVEHEGECAPPCGGDEADCG
ncbi:MAG: hypothetical protein KC620_10115 [Myxococcales bacterium]|nr:hypothetical protein [Myxococcales bacterium]